MVLISTFKCLQKSENKFPKQRWLLWFCWIGVSSFYPVFADSKSLADDQYSLRALTDSPADKALIHGLLQDHLKRLTVLVQKSPRVQVVAYGGKEERARIFPICERFYEQLRAGLVQQPAPSMRMSDGEEPYYDTVLNIAKKYAPAHEERLAAIQESPEHAANARRDFQLNLNTWFLDRNWTYKGMNFSVMNSMQPNSKPRRYVHELWLYPNGQATDGQARYLQLEFFVYQEVGAKKAKIDSIDVYDLTPDRGFGAVGPRLGFNGSWFSQQAWGAQPLDEQHEAFGVAALDDKVLTWDLLRKPKKIDLPPDWRSESWAYKAEIFTDYRSGKDSGTMTCSLLIK